MKRTAISAQLRVRRYFIAQLISWLVGLDGLFVLATTLLDQLATRRASHLSAIIIDVPLLLGLSFMYLSILLARRKRNAWVIALLAYTFSLGVSTNNLLGLHHWYLLAICRSLIVPLAVLTALWLARHEFTVQSDPDVFRTSLKISCIILLATLTYGVTGFTLLDRSDFHQEITPAGAFQHTLDQFELTTDRPLHAYTRRAHLFMDSLSFVSIGSLVYVAVSFFQPVRSRLRGQAGGRSLLGRLLVENDGTSEEFFKLWPHDKQYFFSDDRQAGLAYRVYRGVALVQGDPVGSLEAIPTVIDAFDDVCTTNDWLPAYIHVEQKYVELYQSRGYSLQRLGQEAVVAIDHFQAEVAHNKYFRNIANRFQKQGFRCEIMSPPHAVSTVQELQTISNQWLTKPGRREHGFTMGYFSNAYLQQCQLLVARDGAGKACGFLNLVPAPFDREEATYDFLRHGTHSPSNINDFMLLNLIDHLQIQGYKRLNLGLSPLVGLDSDEAVRSLVDTILRFAYLNGDRFYSFAGLKRFKDKYEPTWTDRYAAYKGGLRGFSRVTNALLRVLNATTENR